MQEVYSLAAVQHECVRRNEGKKGWRKLPSDASVPVMASLQIVHTMGHGLDNVDHKHSKSRQFCVTF